jgi:hypothetical protein
MNNRKRSHRQNIDNLETITLCVETFEPVYNPSETRLSIPNQKKLKADCDAVMSKLGDAKTDSKNASSARKATFDGFDGLVTRVINALRITDVLAQTVKQGESIVRKLRNKKVPKNDTPIETTEGSEKDGPGRRNKRRNGSFGAKIENFDTLIEMLEIIPAYHPNETDLTVAALGKKLKTLRSANSRCIEKDAVTDAVRQERNILLYAPRYGLVNVALDTKRYVKSAYGATSLQYKMISGISFTKMK